MNVSGAACVMTSVWPLIFREADRVAMVGFGSTVNEDCAPLTPLAGLEIQFTGFDSVQLKSQAEVAEKFPVPPVEGNEFALLVTAKPQPCAGTSNPSVYVLLDGSGSFVSDCP